MEHGMSNLAAVVYRRTYSRNIGDTCEAWPQTIERVIAGNVANRDVSPKEIARLRHFMLARKALPGGRGLWYSGTESHSRLGGAACTNCWAFSGDDWRHLVVAQDMLMLGGGVGLSVEHEFVSQLPRIRRGVVIEHRPTKDAEFIVPDSREGWCALLERVLESYFETGRSFSYSTICIRPQGDLIRGFGGTASGPKPLVAMVEKICSILGEREGRQARSIDVADVLCSVGEMVVSGNVRRSALILLGDPWDKLFLRAKRWDLGTLPTQRAMANFSVVCDDADDLHPLFWETYRVGEAFGLINRKNIRQYARMGDKRKDTAYLTNPCFGSGTLIHTHKGHFSIESLVGQSIEIWDGNRWFEVNNFRVTGHDQSIIKIVLQDGSEERVTPYHVVILDDGRRVKAHEVQKGDRLATSTAPLVHGDHAEPGAYLKGFLVGDGALINNNARLALYPTKFACVKRLLRSVAEVPVEEVRTNALSEPGFNVVDLQDRRWMTGLSVRKSLISWVDDRKKRLPLGIFSWDKYSKLEFVAGVMDADGTASDTGHGFMYQICSIYRAWLGDFQALLKTLGVLSKLALMRRGGPKDFDDGYGEYESQDCWRLTISQESSVKLASEVTFSRLISFAEKKLAYEIRSKFNTVVSVEPDGVESKVYCCTVDSTNSLALTNGILMGQCAEATLENGEACNLADLALPNFSSVEEFEEAARLMFRYTKRVSCEPYHQAVSQEVIARNRRVGIGITGCLESPLFNPKDLDRVYRAIQDEDVKYSKELKVPHSIRISLIKPSGSLSKLMDVRGEGIHPGFSRHMIQRIRFSGSDPLVDKLRGAGHRIEPLVRLDGSADANTMVVDFYVRCPDTLPTVDEGFDTWAQLEAVLTAQRYWADQSVSATVYFQREEISRLKSWISLNLPNLKTISFLAYSDHGFKQAPKEAISAEEYDKLTSSVQPVALPEIGEGELLDDAECNGGACPVR